MANITQQLASAARMARYKLYRRGTQPGWAAELSEDELAREVARWYQATTGRVLDLAHPTSFSEKMQWLKVYDHDPRKTTLSDKLAVRPFVAEVAGEGVLPVVYRSWDTPEEVDFAGLPQRFFFKCTTGSGMMSRIEDAAATDIEALRERATGWFARDFAGEYFEMHYAPISPRLYAEEWIDDILWEYQAWCFDGQPAFVAAIHDPHGVNEKQFFSPAWERLPFVSSQPTYQGSIERPGCLDKLLAWSAALAADFPFVRVDWYGTSHGLLFSEMSFTPAYGLVHWDPARYDDEVGALLHLPGQE